MAYPARNSAKVHRSRRESAAAPAGRRNHGRSANTAEAIVIAFILAIVLRTFLVQAYKIPSGSMEPTLLDRRPHPGQQDHLWVADAGFALRPRLRLRRNSYGHYVFHLEPVHRGDVVVFVFPPDPTKDFIKRVIGVGGDTVQVKNGAVFLNGAPMPDPHAHFEVPPRESDRPYSPRDNYRRRRRCRRASTS